MSNDTLLPYERFYRRFGVRLVNQLNNPKVHPYRELMLPKNSMYHWLGYDENSGLGITRDDQVARTVPRHVFAENVLEYLHDDPVGNPRRLPLVTNTKLRQYYQTNKKIRRLRVPLDRLTDERSLLVYNYGLINQKYRYVTNRAAELNRWLNFYRTVYFNVARLAALTERHQFIEVEVPVTLPPLSALRQAENGLTVNSLRRLKTPEDWQIAELYHLITEGYHAYIYKDVADHHAILSKINLILKTGDRYSILNLGVLMGFAGDKESDAAARTRLAKRYLRGLMSMQSHMTVGEITPENTNDLTAETQAISDDDEDRIEIDDEEILPPPVKKGYDPFHKTSPVNEVLTPEQELPIDTDEDALEDAQLDEDLKQLELISEDLEEHLGAYHAYVANEESVEQKIERKAQRLAKVGLMTPAEVNRVKKQAARVEHIVDPRSKNKPLVEAVRIAPEELKIDEGAPLVDPSVVGIADPSMTHTTLNKFDKEYIEVTLNKDIAQMSLSLQQAGIMVLDYKVERETDITNDFEVHKVKVQPVGGQESTISFKVPKVKNDGTFMVNGTINRMRRQRSALPIVKVAPDEVSLTSYYSKMFVTRTPRKQFNYTLWLGNEIVTAGILGDKDSRIGEVKLSDVFDPSIKVPQAYSAIAMRLNSFECQGVPLYFNVNKIEENLGVSYNPKRDTKIAIGKIKERLIYLDFDGRCDFDGTFKPIESVLGLEVSKRPIEFAEVKIFSKAIPVGMVLAYQIGLGRLLTTLKARVKRYKPREAITLEPHEYVLRFLDQKLVLDQRDKVATLLLSGFRRFHNTLKKYSVYDFDQHGVYNNLLNDIKVPLRYLNEIPLMFDLWVDHITRDILIEMKEPTDLLLLFIRSCELLLDDTHPDPTDTLYMRDRGYERFSGILYNELVVAMRKYQSKPLNKNNKFELHPDAVWYGILQDESVILSEQSNPIHECKEQEIVVYRGAGGRSSQSMTAPYRRFHKNSLGVTSEATVDNSSTGTVVYTSFSPNYINVRGMSKPVDVTQEVKPAQLVSTSMLLAAGSENDDAKRVGFIAVQNSATTYCKNYTPVPVRTGAERVIGSRTGNMFNVNAKAPCTVTKISKDAISVKYEDGTTESFKLGRMYGKSSAKDIPYSVVSACKLGDKLKVGQNILYNEEYFQLDPLNKKQTIFKMALNARVAFVEGNDGYEDSCAMSAKMAGRMETGMTHIREIIVNRDQGIYISLEDGDTVSSDTILCTIFNEQSESAIFNEREIETLAVLGSLTPRAKYQGVLEKIECLYVPEIEQMTETLQELVTTTDRALFKSQTALGEPRISGKVKAGYRVKGNTLTLDNILIRFYITEDVGMSVGDKLVVSNQLKSTVGRIWNEPTVSEDGREVDLFFGYQSVDNRIVGSPELIGTTASILIELGRQMVDVYENG